MNPTSNDSTYLDRWRRLPSDWMAWGPAAFDAARELDRPILLSIGYPSSTWCKKLADNVFSDPSVSAAIDDGFVAIAVDRDTRPDIDAAYMAALISVAGRGGWPLTALIDHLGRPFWLGTYLTPEAMTELLTTMADTWRSDRDKILNTAAQVTERVNAAARISPADSVPSLDMVNHGLGQLGGAFDPEWGGFGREPKFPSPPHLQLMHRAALSSGADAPANVVRTTLAAMSAGGVYDQIGGGFHRYATDREWLLPQFEKTLADQAQLVAAYQDGFSMWGDPLYRRVVFETVGYVLATLQNEAGGFTSGEAGESPGPDGVDRPGAFYTWTPDELRALLTNARVDDDPVDVDAVLEWFDITADGHLEGRSIPNRRHHRDDQLPSPQMIAVRGGLNELRARRPRPPADLTVVTEHHCLMTTALASAAVFFRMPVWRDAAVSAGDFLLDHLRERTRWYRSWLDGPRGEALAGDYAAAIIALIRLADLTGEVRWLDAAVEAADILLDNFFDPIDGGLWSTSEFGEELFVRLKQLEDRASPSPNSLAADGLLRLAALTGEMRYKHQAERILQVIAGVPADQALTVPHGLAVAEMFHRGLFQIVIARPQGAPPLDWLGQTDDEAARMIRLVGTLWRPNYTLWWGDSIDSPLMDGRTAVDHPVAYLARDFETIASATTAEELYEVLAGKPLQPDQQLNV